MKQWRTIVVVMGLIILFLIANFSVQITTRRRRNSSKVGDPKKASSVSQKNGTFRGKLKKKSNSSSIEDAVIIPDSKCWEEEETQILAECIHCSDYEKRTLLGCQESGNIQLTLCIVSNIKLYKSCPHVIEWEEKKFWMFEGLMLIGLMVSSSVVWYRQRQLDSIFYEKLQKQVESDTV